MSSISAPSKPSINIESNVSQPPDIVFGYPCIYHRKMDSLLNKDVVIKCEFKVDKGGLIYHVCHFKTISSAKLITQLSSCRYVLGYDGNIITLYELIHAQITTPISGLTPDTRFIYLSVTFNNIFNYVYELTDKKLINNYLIGNDHNIKFFCDNIAFVNAENQLSFILRFTLTSIDSNKSRAKFMKQYTSILTIVKYILFRTNSKLSYDRQTTSGKVEKDNGKKIQHGGICKLKNYRCRMNYIDEGLLHSVYCMQVSTRYPNAYKLLRLIDIFNIPSEPNTSMIHQVFELL